MRKSNARAGWQGDLKDGSGNMELGSGAFSGAFSFGTRFGSEGGTNPEELIGAALAGCFSMALANGLSEDGHVPDSIDTKAEVSFGMVDGTPTVQGIHLNVEGKVPGLEQDAFAAKAEEIRTACPVSRALAGTEITVDARLAG